MERPTAETVWRAIHIYLKHAYEGPPPRAIQLRIDALRAPAGGDFYGCPVFERGKDADADRLSLRLGNRCYPHMKLVIQRAPGGRAYLFAADTHDGHALPEPGSPDYEAFRALMEQNRAIAQSIETAWTAEGLATFRQLLLADLALRQAPPIERNHASFE